MHNPELTGLINLLEKSIQDFKNFEDNESKAAIFGLACKVLYVGSSLTDLSGSTLEPSSIEAKQIIAQIKYHLNGMQEMPLGTLIMESDAKA